MSLRSPQPDLTITRFRSAAAAFERIAAPYGRWASAIDQYGDLRVREHFDRLAAENNRRDTATPVRGHHDQIAPSRRGGIDDCLIDVIVLDVKRIAGDTC